MVSSISQRIITKIFCDSHVPILILLLLDIQVSCNTLSESFRAWVAHPDVSHPLVEPQFQFYKLITSTYFLTFYHLGIGGVLSSTSQPKHKKRC